MYVHVHACVCAHICRLWTSAEVLWGPQKALSVLCYSWPIPLIKFSLSEPGVYLSLPTLEASQPQGSWLHILKSWVIGIGWKLGLLHEYWDLNSGPHNCMTSAEPSISPILWMLECLCERGAITEILKILLVVWIFIPHKALQNVLVNEKAIVSKY